MNKLSKKESLFWGFFFLNIMLLHDINFLFFIIFFMSEILYQGNNLVVSGELWSEYHCEPTPTDENLRRALHLNFIVQINWKMIVHKEALVLVVKKGVDPELEEWNTWYVICNIFFSFWYSLSEEKSSFLYNTSGIIREWISKLIEQERNKSK